MVKSRDYSSPGHAPAMNLGYDPGCAYLEEAQPTSFTAGHPQQTRPAWRACLVGGLAPFGGAAHQEVGELDLFARQLLDGVHQLR